MYEINYEDEQFQKVEAEKQAALNESNKMYDDMIAQSDKYYQDQINANKDWTEKQTELQNEQTDFIIDTIEQQKKETEKDYIKEQKGAYVDWQKESNKYGSNAEQMASSGLSGSGYAESSQVGMYNTYQNRVAVAREGFERAKTNYENNIKEAMLQNNAALAEIAYQGYINECQLLLQQFQYKNELLMAKSNAQTQITGRADTKYQAVLDQMNAENALREQIRQYNTDYQLKLNEGEYNAFLLRKEIEGATDYESALNLLRTKGILGQDESGDLIDKKEWMKRRSVKVPASYEHPEMAYDSYEEYLANYLSCMFKLE